MNKYGYIKLPRSISVLKGAKRWLLAHICTEAAYCSTDHPTLGQIARGELVTSRNQLAEDTGLTPMQVRHALEALEALGYIAIEAAARYTKIAITWPDYVQLRDNDIMLNNQVINQVDNQSSNQVTTSASVEVSAHCEDSHENDAQSVTKSITKSVTNNSNKNIINNKHTHSNSNNPGITKSAPARDTHTHVHTHAQPAEVVELQEWMMRNTPDFYAMPRPFTPAELRRMIERYPMADIQRLLMTAWSKGICVTHRSAYAAFRSFADNDRVLHQRQREDADSKRLYTYEEVADYIHRHGGTTDQHFQMIHQPGEKPKWKRTN